MMVKPFQLIKISFFIFALLIVLIIVLASIWLPNNTINDLSGSVGKHDNENIILTMSFPSNWIYSFGDLWCHQKSERSFYINENQMPVCARCFGIFLGISMGLGYSIFVRTKINKNIHKKILILLTIGYAPLVIDGVGQLIGFWESTNALRVITGIFVGVTFGIIVGIAIDVINLAFSKRRNRNLSKLPNNNVDDEA